MSLPSSAAVDPDSNVFVDSTAVEISKFDSGGELPDELGRGRYRRGQPVEKFAPAFVEHFVAGLENQTRQRPARARMTGPSRQRLPWTRLSR